MRLHETANRLKDRDAKPPAYRRFSPTVAGLPNVTKPSMAADAGSRAAHVAVPREEREYHDRGCATMIASLLLAAAAATSSAPPADTSLGISLRIVEACDLVSEGNRACVGAEYDRWLDLHTQTRQITDDQGRQVVEIRF